MVQVGRDLVVETLYWYSFAFPLDGGKENEKRNSKKHEKEQRQEVIHTPNGKSLAYIPMPCRTVSSLKTKKTIKKKK